MDFIKIQLLRFWPGIFQDTYCVQVLYDYSKIVAAKELTSNCERTMVGRTPNTRTILIADAEHYMFKWAKMSKSLFQQITNFHENEGILL